VFVLTVSYAGGRTRQFSVRRERVAEVRQWLDNYHKLKEAIETICELNHDLLRPDSAGSKTKPGRKKHDRDAARTAELRRRERYAILTGHRIDLCPVCAGRMVEIARWPRSASPPRPPPRCDTS
jgi:hypothetical protein